jgi:hypothetical protein
MGRKGGDQLPWTEGYDNQEGSEDREQFVREPMGRRSRREGRLRSLLPVSLCFFWPEQEVEHSSETHLSLGTEAGGLKAPGHTGSSSRAGSAQNF